MRDILIEAYYDYWNNFSSYQDYAEHNGLTESEALALIALCKHIMSHRPPQA